MVRVFSHWLPANSLLQMAIDLLLVCLSLVISVAWLDRGDLRGVALMWPYALLFALGMMALNSFFGVYQRDTDRSTLRTAVFAVAILCFLLAVPTAYGMLSPPAPSKTWREELGLALLLSLVLMAALRGYALRSGVGPLLVRRVMVLGTGADAAAVEQGLSASGPYVRFMGFYPTHSDEPPQVAGDRLLAAGDSLAQTARRLKVDEIIVAVREQRADGELARQLLDCRTAGICVLDLSTYFERAFGQVRLDSLRASWLIFGDGFRQGPLRNMAKRLFDVCAATLLLAVFWPVMLLSAMLIVLDSGWPIFYGQKRVGQAGRQFRVLKFRSMRQDAEPDGKPRWAASGDARVTRVGRLLRRLRIDELPQIWNILRGDMSLCGPRPERPYFVDRLTREIPFYGVRHSVKPGVTGWAQVNYSYYATVEEMAIKLEYDLYYIKRRNLLMDSLILLRTVGQVFGLRGR